ncbi:permease, partial [Pseudomonas syringae pv. tagetis]
MINNAAVSALKKPTTNVIGNSDNTVVISPYLSGKFIFNWSLITIARSPSELFWTQLGTIF